jgi:hypothetical protein
MTSLNSTSSNGFSSNGFNGSSSMESASGSDQRPVMELVCDANGRWVKMPKGARPTGATSTADREQPLRRRTPAVNRPEGNGRRPPAAGTAGQHGTALALVRFLETNGATQDLKVAAGQHLFDQSTTSKTRSRWLRKLLASTGLWTFGEDLHGNQAVTKGVRDQSHLPAQVLSASTLLDFGGSFGLFKFIWQGSPLGAIPSALITSGVLLYLGHRSGGGMVNRLKSNGTASVSMAFFIAISSFQSLTAGVGVFLFNGQAQVVNHRAGELVAVDFDRRRQRISTLQDPANHRLLQADLAQCESNSQRLDAGGSKNPAYQQLSVETFGRWEDRRVAPSNQPRWVIQNWPQERWPICPRATASKAELERRIDGESRQLEELEQQLQNAPSQAAFLRKSRPEVFEEHFRSRPDGGVEMKDGLKAFGAAWKFFWFPPVESRSDLTLSFIIMWLSIGTSTAAFLLLLRYSLKDETKMSFSELCGQYRGELLSELQRRLPDEAFAYFRDLDAKDRLEGRPKKQGVKLQEIDKLNPEFQTLAYLVQNGDAEVQQQARQQYFERLVDLFIQRSSVTGEIDYAYLANKVKRYWEDLKVADQARVTPHGSDLSGTRPL